MYNDLREGSIPEYLIAENIQLRNQVKDLEEAIDMLREKNVDEWVSGKHFLSNFYKKIALMIDGDWKEIGDELNWSPEHIALAEIIAAALRQDIFNKANLYSEINT